MSAFPKAGETFNFRYELLEILGSGGLGTVFKARQIDANRNVALKVFHSQFDDETEFNERFRREAKALSEIEHIGIVKIYHVGISDKGFMYIAMELLNGNTLKQILDEQKKLTALRALAIVHEIAAIVSFVHERGIVHRDLKPANLMLLDVPAPDSVKLLDFGLAYIENAQKLTATGMVVGTPQYMSPEQCEGQRVDSRSDVYSLTVCFYELLSGRLPFIADSPVGVLYMHRHEPIPKLSKADLGRGVEHVNALIAKGMDKNPDKRFQSMDEFMLALEELEEKLHSQSVDLVSSKGLIATILASAMVSGLLLVLWHGLNLSGLSTAPSKELDIESDRRAKHSIEAITREFASTEERFTQARDKNSRSRYASRLITLSRELGKHYFTLKQYSNSEEALLKAVKLCDLVPDQVDRAKIMLDLALYAKPGDYKQQIRYLLQGLDSNQTDFELRTKTAFSLATAQLNDGNYEGANEGLAQLLSSCANTPGFYRYNNLGSLGSNPPGKAINDFLLLLASKKPSSIQDQVTVLKTYLRAASGLLDWRNLEQGSLLISEMKKYSAKIPDSNEYRDLKTQAALMIAKWEKAINSSTEEAARK